MYFVGSSTSKPKLNHSLMGKDPLIALPQSPISPALWDHEDIEHKLMPSITSGCSVKHRKHFYGILSVFIFMSQILNTKHSHLQPVHTLGISIQVIGLDDTGGMSPSLVCSWAAASRHTEAQAQTDDGKISLWGWSTSVARSLHREHNKRCK